MRSRHSAIAALSVATLFMFTLACNKAGGPEPSPEQDEVFDSTPSAIMCLPQAVAGGVIAYYPFSSGSLHDFSGNGHHLSNTTTAAPAPDRAGNPSCAFGFHYLSTPGEMLTLQQTAFLDTLPAFSISLWYYAEDTSRNAGAYETLVSRDTGFDCPDRMGNWSVGLYDLRHPVFGMYQSVWDTNGMASMTSNVTDGVALTTNKWRHLVATYDSAAGERVTIYVNGVPQETRTGLASCSPLPRIFRRGALFFGYLYTGRIDDVILYDRVLSPVQIRQLSKLSPCCSDQ